MLRYTRWWLVFCLGLVFFFPLSSEADHDPNAGLPDFYSSGFHSGSPGSEDVHVYIHGPGYLDHQYAGVISPGEIFIFTPDDDGLWDYAGPGEGWLIYVVRDSAHTGNWWNYEQLLGLSADGLRTAAANGYPNTTFVDLWHATWGYKRYFGNTYFWNPSAGNAPINNSELPMLNTTVLPGETFQYWPTVDALSGGSSIPLWSNGESVELPGIDVNGNNWDTYPGNNLYWSMFEGSESYVVYKWTYEGNEWIWKWWRTVYAYRDAEGHVIWTDEFGPGQGQPTPGAPDPVPGNDPPGGAGQGGGGNPPGNGGNDAGGGNGGGNGGNGGGGGNGGNGGNGGGGGDDPWDQSEIDLLISMSQTNNVILGDLLECCMQGHIMLGELNSTGGLLLEELKKITDPDTQDLIDQGTGRSGEAQDARTDAANQMNAVNQGISDEALGILARQWQPITPAPPEYFVLELEGHGGATYSFDWDPRNWPEVVGLANWLKGLMGTLLVMGFIWLTWQWYETRANDLFSTPAATASNQQIGGTNVNWLQVIINGGAIVTIVAAFGAVIAIEIIAFAAMDTGITDLNAAPAGAEKIVPCILTVFDMFFPWMLAVSLISIYFTMRFAAGIVAMASQAMIKFCNV